MLRKNSYLKQKINEIKNNRIVPKNPEQSYFKND
jgi:hypothetical protein